MDSLKFILEKLSQYSILTNILPGAVLCIILTYLVGYDMLFLDDWFLQGIVFYFVGMVNNRFGSLVVEPLLKKCGFLKFSPYKDFMRAEKVDPKIETLSTENNVFRSYNSLGVLAIFALIFKAIENNCAWVQNCCCQCKTAIILLLLLVLFGFSYRKQTSYVYRRVNNAIKNEEKQMYSDYEGSCNSAK